MSENKKKILKMIKESDSGLVVFVRVENTKEDGSTTWHFTPSICSWEDNEDKGDGRAFMFSMASAMEGLGMHLRHVLEPKKAKKTEETEGETA